ncbi:hypothetical protein [Litorihabitans aurantiacus]|uniref:hypothetical protein n=1 Tax=Litorihabitans aurantiacus TaxID=1930061 RepID=UPI0024E11FCB|nr:hypothetical protein [Litorihabitans aurantiacus]
MPHGDVNGRPVRLREHHEVGEREAVTVVLDTDDGRVLGGPPPAVELERLVGGRGRGEPTVGDGGRFGRALRGQDEHVPSGTPGAGLEAQPDGLRPHPQLLRDATCRLRILAVRVEGSRRLGSSALTPPRPELADRGVLGCDGGVGGGSAIRARGEEAHAWRP